MKIINKFILLSVVGCLLWVNQGCSKVSDPDGQPELGRTRSVTFCLHNLLTYDIYVEVSQVCNHDWQSQNRPERLERAYTPGESYYHQMDMNAWDRTFPATLTFYRWDPVNKVKVGSAIDQWRMKDMNAINDAYIEQMNSGYKGKIKVVTSRGDSGIHAALVYGNITLTNWVSDLPDSAYLSELAFPGTHDSGTFNYTGILSEWVVCQHRSFSDTMNQGCRAFDIRLAPYSDTELKIVHGSYNTGLKLTSSFLTDCKNFLASHPREVIVMKVQKDDGDASTVMNTLNTILNQSEWKDLIYTISSTTAYPKLSEVRGKIVMIYDGGIYDSRSKGYWLNYQSDTSAELTNEATTPNLLWYVHDNWQATNASMKISHVAGFYNNLMSLSQAENTVMPICFLSAAEHNFWTALNTPTYFAQNVNPYICGKIAEINPAKRTGLVFMDFYATRIAIRTVGQYVYYDYISDNDYNGLGYLVIAKNYYRHNLIPTP